ncbi:protein outspread [Diorhabda sublineata]|uniref:protein outspread n=1 Tax=Diorhabda sublineata TaxID=1163346 RepID=UPI0024E060EE|nr:protein outspread [Diorhabda sublineata]
MSQCKKFAPNIFHKTKCSNCFRQKEEHSAEALECNRASRSIARSGYLFVAPDWDFSVPLNRTKRWQRRWFVLYDDGELNYSVDEHPDTVPQGSVDMCKVLEVTGAEQVTGHPHSLALTSPDRVTFVKAASREDARWWAELLAVFPRRHKRNATFPGGRASPSLPQLGRSASPQPPRPRHLSVTGPSPRTNFETPPLKEERESPPKEQDIKSSPPLSWTPPVRTNSLPIETPNPPITPAEYLRPDYIVSSGSPPTRDKLRCDDKVRARKDWRNERLRDIATALTDQHRPLQSESSNLTLPAEGLLHLKKGWLWQKNSDSDWVRRWIVLCCPTIQIYQDQDEQNNPELTIELSSVTNCIEVSTSSKYGFEIQWAGPSLVLCAVTHGIRCNWLQALRKAANLSTDSVVPVESPISPSTPRSLLASSDEEYRTASEGGRRGSEDWSELPPSPPMNRLSLNRVKDRARLRPRLPRCQSRHSTLDSTSTDELDCAKEPDTVHLHNAINDKQNEEIVELQLKLQKAAEEVRLLEEEVARLKKVQSDAAIREKKAKEMLSNLEKHEMELNQRNSQIEINFLKEQRALQRRLSEAEESARIHEEKCDLLSRDLQTKQRMLVNLQDELITSNERLSSERDEKMKLTAKIQELEGRYNYKGKSFKTDSIRELTNINLDLDIDEMNQNELKKYFLDLKSRFERAIMEILAMKKAVRECEENCDKLEITNHRLTNSTKLKQQEHEAEVKLLVQRLDHLTSKLAATEKQLKVKSKTEAKDKRRSLSLKGRESFSINKEVEDKVTELEAKIMALERGKNRRRYKRDRSGDRGSPIDDKSLRRLRRKSLDSATSSEPMKLLMRLSSLETKVTSVDASNESLDTPHGSMSDLSKPKETTTNNKNIDIDFLLSSAKLRVNDCLNSIYLLKNNRKRASSPSLDRLISIENSLNELLDILNRRDCSVSTGEIEVINTSAGAVVKQLQNLLLNKLTNLAEKKRLLQENNNWDSIARLQILAEKVAYENILVSRIQEALLSPVTGEAICDRLIKKEIRETAYLIISLENKINGSSDKKTPSCKTSAEYLSKILAKCLVSAAHGFKFCKNFITAKGSSINILCDEKRNLDNLLTTYKTDKLPQLAESLALETICMSSDQSCRIDTVANEFSKAARDVVNTELIRSEINHVLLRAAQVYQSNLDEDHAYFFSFFASERAALELWSDSVGDCLFEEVNKSITELTDLYQNSLNKLLKQNWRCRMESVRNARTSTTLLHEYAEIIAHKSLIDARIAVLSGEYVPEDYNDSRNRLSCWFENDKYWSLIEDESLLQINQSLEAEFNCMVEKFSRDCYAVLSQPELEEVLGYLNEMSSKVKDLHKSLNVPVNREDLVLRNWSDVCQMCLNLRNSLEDIRKALEENNSFRKYSSLEDERPVYLRTEYLTQVENLRAAYRRALATCKDRHKEEDMERLQQLCERVLSTMEQWHLRTIHELRDAHAQEVELLKQEKEQALAEETQATLAALDAMRKAHVAEVQREVAKFKQDFVRQQRDSMFDLSEQLSVKSLETAALEEQLGTATRQLAHAQQHILKLERNPQISTLQN